MDPTGSTLLSTADCHVASRANHVNLARQLCQVMQQHPLASDMSSYTDEAWWLEDIEATVKERKRPGGGTSYRGFLCVQAICNTSNFEIVLHLLRDPLGTSAIHRTALFPNHTSPKSADLADVDVAVDADTLTFTPCGHRDRAVHRLELVFA
jgi:hypothetical protein